MWSSFDIHSHAKTTTGVHQAVTQDLILPTITLNICLIELEFKKKKYACSRMLVVNKQN